MFWLVGAAHDLLNLRTTCTEVVEYQNACDRLKSRLEERGAATDSPTLCDLFIAYQIEILGLPRSAPFLQHIPMLESIAEAFTEALEDPADRFWCYVAFTERITFENEEQNNNIEPVEYKAITPQNIDNLLFALPSESM